MKRIFKVLWIDLCFLCMVMPVNAKEDGIGFLCELAEWYNAPLEDCLTVQKGTIEGPSGKETYYNLDMSSIVQRLENMGVEGSYWVRQDGVKMYGQYVMVAANLDLRSLGTVLPTSLGLGIVCDTGGFASANPTQLDIAVTW